MRQKDDFYRTTPGFAHALFQNAADVLPDVFWECAVGDGALVDVAEQYGKQAVGSDIVVRGTVGIFRDFFDFTEAWKPFIITNPPFKHIRPWVRHGFKSGVQGMALLHGHSFWSCAPGFKLWNEHKPHIVGQMTFREDFLGKGGNPNMTLAWSIWLSPKNDGECAYRLWGKPIIGGLFDER